MRRIIRAPYRLGEPNDHEIIPSFSDVIFTELVAAIGKGLEVTVYRIFISAKSTTKQVPLGFEIWKSLFHTQPCTGYFNAGLWIRNGFPSPGRWSQEQCLLIRFQ